MRDYAKRELDLSYDAGAEFALWMNQLAADDPAMVHGHGDLPDERQDADAPVFCGGMSEREDRLRDRAED